MIFHSDADIIAADEFDRFVKASPWERHMARMKFGAGDDPRLAEGRQTHGLRTIEFWILKGGEADELCDQSRWKLRSVDVHLVGDDDPDARRQRRSYPPNLPSP
jgi:hypothetical protein